MTGPRHAAAVPGTPENPEPGRARTTAPVPPVAIAGDAASAAEHLPGERVPLDDAFLATLRSTCRDVSTEGAQLAEAGRDWWPISIGWATRGEVPAKPGALARPRSTAEVSALLAACNQARVPVTPLAGRSGVCGASVPLFGGVALDMTAMAGIEDLDLTSLVARVAPGTFGPELEAALQAEGVSLGHWPQSIDLSTVGGWIACRGAGQYSTRYGKIEDMVAGLEVVLADGRVARTGAAAPRAAMGPDLTQTFVGSEGTLGVVTSAWLRLHRLPPAEARRAYGFAGFAEGLDTCRRVLQRGATPAVLRLYDAEESERHFATSTSGASGTCALVVLDEAEPSLLDATMRILDEECRAAGAAVLSEELVAHWLERRNDVSALAPLYQGGIVVDTIEVAGTWNELPALYEDCVSGLRSLPGTLAASAHQSHAYPDGACLYFTFAGREPDAGEATVLRDATRTWDTSYYTEAWDIVMRCVMSRGCAISHHHGIGVNRARFMEESMGEAFSVLAALKGALDPRGIMNPGKLGLPSPFGELAWP